MFLRDDEELFSIGAASILEGSDEPDTTSDVSIWVQQYTEWEEVEPLRKSVPKAALGIPPMALSDMPASESDRVRETAVVFS